MFPPQLLQRLGQYATDAAAARLAAMQAVHAALNNDHSAIAMAMRQGWPAEGSDQHRWALRFLVLRVIDQTDISSRLSKDVLGRLDEWLASTSHQSNTTSAVRESLERCRQCELVVRESFNSLFVESFHGRDSLGVACNPLAYTARRALKRFPLADTSIDDLLSEGYIRGVQRIDTFKGRTGAEFLCWWSMVVRNVLGDMYRRRIVREPRNAPNAVQDPAVHCTAESIEPPFADSDWRIFQDWVRRDVPAVVLIVGFDWVEKVWSHQGHQADLRQWLEAFGVLDADRFRQQCRGGSRSERFQNLAELAGRDANSLRNTFARRFAGIQQSARQASFGHYHRVVDLSCFWESVAGRSIGEQDVVLTQLTELPVGARVTALCCTATWDQLPSQARWRELANGYRFSSGPPLLEFVQPDLEVKPEHRDRIPREITSEADTTKWIRQIILAHGTAGKFSRVLDDVAQWRKIGLPQEDKLRDFAVGRRV